MNIEVTDTTIIKQIQEDFNKKYPFLWIDFLSHDAVTADHFKSVKIKAETIMGELGSFDGTKEINIDGTTTVSEVESAFWLTFNLITKVMRKSGKAWVATSFTGNWTLDNQNFEGQLFLD
jgi:hypothetical protein